MASSQTTEGPLIDGKKTLVRFTHYFQKNPGLSDEEFEKYWVEKHGPLFTSLPIVKEKLVKYSQFHLSPKYKEKLVSLFGPDHWITEYDGSADLWAKDLESIMAIFTDEQFLGCMIEDTKNFTNGSAKSMVGYDHVQLDQTSQLA